MSTINLSYVITTYNKLYYLKEVLRLLLTNKKEDEEIVITDGGSTDGTVAFLTDLFDKGKIDQFISEKDKGEAHGYNKSFLMAKGSLVKIITDDDVFNYTAIKEMKEYMLMNPDIDALSGNILSVNVIHSPTFFEFRKSYQLGFEKWISGEVNATFFSCLPLMLRKNKIPLIGFFDTSFKHVDLEYSVRLTSQKRKVGFYTGLVSIGLVNEQSVSAQELSYTSIFQKELKRLQGNFDYKHLQGIKNISKPWLRHHFFEKNTFLWKFADKFKICQTKITYYPQYDVKLLENIELPNKNVPDLFKYFEAYYEKALKHFEKNKFILPPF